MKDNHHFYAIDLFAGCGGLSEGFKQAGFDVIAQVEMDRWACETLRTRHLFYELKAIGKRNLYNEYLQEKATKGSILDKYNHIRDAINHRVIQATFTPNGTTNIFNKIEESLDFHGASRFHVVIGGPPCQPFSVVGRARDPFRMNTDNRHYLYRYYLKILERFQPDFFVYENVPGLFTAKKGRRKIFTTMLRDFHSLNPSYEVTPPLEHIIEEPGNYVLDASNYRVPQSRRRLVFIGYKKSLERNNSEIKEMFSVLQQTGIRNIKEEILTVSDAISDLPPLKPGKGSDGWLCPYGSDKNLKEYQINLRRESPGILNHKARSQMKSDRKRYRFFIKHRKEGDTFTTLDDLAEERPDLLPNHRHLNKFIDRFKVQWWTKPSLTITAHISHDGHYFIHPNISQCRSFTVREAARCQSFPDNYKFEGPRTEQFKHVGNAVPPILARSIAKVVRTELKRLCV